MPFRNRDELATSLERKLALDIAAAGLEALAPETLLRKFLRFNPERRILEAGDIRFSPDVGRLFLIGGGKAADVMALALENLVGPDTFTAGIVVCKTQSAWPLKIQVREAGHPIPDHRGLTAMRDMTAMKDEYGIGENDLVVCLLSGGASALMPGPAPGLTLEDKQRATRMLLACGADISEANIIRRHLSLSKGGKLGRHFAPAKVLSLILSDVIGNDLSTIGSGPTCPEKSRPEDAMKLLRHYNLWDKLPSAVRHHLEETRPLPSLGSLPNCANHIIGDSSTALNAMAHKAADMNKNPKIISNSVKGPPEIAARQIAANILNGMYHGHDVLLAAGETTPILPKNHGQGGRNQHFAASTLLDLKELSSDWAHISLGSDGSDYLPDVAGALVDRDVLKKAIAKGLSVQNHLDRFDTHSLFQEIGGCLVETGPTGTNVGDLMIYVL